MRILIIICIATLLQPFRSQHPVDDYDLVIQNVKLFDGDIVHENATVLLQKDTIAAVMFTPTAFSGQNVMDGKGKTLIPGLINAHVHVNNSKDKTAEQKLQEAAQQGVLTVLDLFREAQEAQRLRAMRNTPGQADFFSAGPVATPPGGHGTQWGETPTIATPEAAAAFIHERVQEGADFIKIIKEAHIRKVSLPDDVVYELVKETRKAGLVSVVHIDDVHNALVAFDAGADGLAHIWLFDNEPVDAKSLAHLASRPFFVTPTLMLHQKGKTIADQTGHPVAFFAKQVHQLHDAGITILAGTDAGNFGITIGTDLFTEMALYVAGGMTPVEVLKTATSNIADAYRLHDRGRIAVGKRADIILIDGDPTNDINDIKNISRIWQGGIPVIPNGNQ